MNEDAVVFTGFCCPDVAEAINPGLRYPMFIDCGPVQGFPESLAQSQKTSVLRAMGPTIPDTSFSQARDATVTCTGVDWSVAALRTHLLTALFSFGELMLNALFCSACNTILN